VFASNDDEGWIASAIQSESFSQPLEAKCAIGRIVWEESQRRGISVRELATETSFLSGWKYGGEWHIKQYLNPLPQFREIAKQAMSESCSSFDARWFDQQYFVETLFDDGYILNEEGELLHLTYSVNTKKCLPTTLWDRKNKTKLLHESGEICFYGYS
jgi:hypothetical protein